MKKPIGVLTTEAGNPVELREVNLLNTDLMSSTFFFDFMSHTATHRIPDRIVATKGVAARGYFEVTNDISKYTKADVFNGKGKRTPVLVRFALTGQQKGGSDVARALRSIAVKFYTNEGNLDILNLNIPVFISNDPFDFFATVRGITLKNPVSNTAQYDQQWDLVTMRPSLIHSFLYLNSDYGLPDGYRKINFHPIHLFELQNKNGERYFARFNFISEQGLGFLTSAQAAAIQARDLNYFIRDLYNAIDAKQYPSWRLEMQVMSLEELKNLDYNPFDLTRMLKNGTFETVTIGRLVLDRMPDNQFRDNEQSAFNPSNLVPGIPGPIDVVFQARRFTYKNDQNFRLGPNHDKIEVNRPYYAKNYNRDGKPPVRDNMKDAPDYYPNSFSGPVPYVDETKSNELLAVSYSNAVDLQFAADFYNKILTQPQRERLVETLVASLQRVKPKNVFKRALRLLYLTDPDLGKRVQTAYNLAGSCVQ